MIYKSALTLLSVSLITLAFAAKVSASGGETACTPVYGMANTCIEHQVVETGADDAVVYTLSGASYLAGLVSFIKAKLLG